MSYLKLTNDRIEQRLSYFKDKIKDEVKNKVKENIERQGAIGCFAFFVSLIVLGFSAIIAIADEVSALGHTIAFYIGVISFITFTGSMLFVFYTAYLEYNEVRYFKKIYQKVCKGYCEQYRVSNLEDDSSLQKILITIFADEFLEEKTDTEIYQYLYEHRMLKPDELNKIDKFLASNNVNFRSYVLAIDSELLAHIINPYRAEIKKEIKESVASFFLEKDRTKQEEERAKSLERQKQNLFIEKTNGFASSMLGKNLAIQR
jgi:hypothetical protein